MRKRMLFLYGVLLAVALFAGYYVGLPLEERAGGAVPVAEYDNFAYMWAAEGVAVELGFATVQLPGLGGEAWGKPLYLWVMPVLLVALALWQFRALRKLATRDRFFWVSSLLTALVMTLGLFFAFTHHARSMYGTAETATVEAGQKKVFDQVAALKAAGKPVPVTGDNRIDLPKLMGYTYCPNATVKEQSCQWQFKVANGYDVAFVNRDPAFRDMMDPAGVGLWIAWLSVWLGLSANLYLWIAKTGDERVGVDLIYEQGVPSA